MKKMRWSLEDTKIIRNVLLCKERKSLATLTCELSLTFPQRSRSAIRNKISHVGTIMGLYISGKEIKKERIERRNHVIERIFNEK